MPKTKQDDIDAVGTTGHEWDGIQELNNPLPRWWLWTFYLCIIWGIGYVIAYPAWPMISGATTGVLGYSTRAEVAQNIQDHNAKNAELVSQLLAADIDTLDSSDPLHRYAVSRGGAVFRAQCSQCHGSGAAGAPGYPNLLDDDWLWGGTMSAISATIAHGVRNTTDEDARFSQMPAFDDILEDADIMNVTEYVVSLTSADHDADMATKGAVVFKDQCASCHGDTATGDREQGAPNLADAIWLFGGDREALEHTVRFARYGVMPAWGQRLSDEDVRAVTVYVHALGGGE